MVVEVVEGMGEEWGRGGGVEDVLKSVRTRTCRPS